MSGPAPGDHTMWSRFYKRHKGLFLFLGTLLAAAVGYSVLLLVFAWIMRPDMSQLPQPYSAEEIKAAQEARDRGRFLKIDPTNPVRIHREVDYREGEKGRWWPRGESPILKDLVASDELPPVAERVGSEPCVLEGVEGVGNYGGTWVRVANAPGDVGIIWNRMSYVALLRFSPQGYPLVPYLAKSYEVKDDNKTFIFHLRKGMRWSDGHPYTADAILYWWKLVATDKEYWEEVPSIMRIRDKVGAIEKIDDYTVKFTFPEPNGLFLHQVAGFWGEFMVNFPGHYLKKFHPTVGDQELIQAIMKKRNFNMPIQVVRAKGQWSNPECPRVWPWVYRTYKPSSPQGFVRNPYFWCVDPEGNQLPYVDRVLFLEKSANMIPEVASAGEITMQARHIRPRDYTLLMSRRRNNGYEIYHWYKGDRSNYSIFPNLNRKVDPAFPESKWKHTLLNDKRFRIAMSLAIDRERIIMAEYDGQVEAAQSAPGRASYYHHPGLFKAYTEHDPKGANELLDELGLTKRDHNGYRTFPDGSRMVWYLDYTSFTEAGPAEFLVEDWSTVGVHIIARERSRPLFVVETGAMKQDFSVWITNGEFLPIMEPYTLVPVDWQTRWAQGFGRWYHRRGMYGPIPEDKAGGCIEPPKGHPCRRALEIYDRVKSEGDLEKRRAIFREIMDIAQENLWLISICTPPPELVVVKKGFRNVPKAAVASWVLQTPGNAGMETYFFDEPTYQPGEREEIKRAIVEPVLSDKATAEAEDVALVAIYQRVAAEENAGKTPGKTSTAPVSEPEGKAKGLAGRAVKWLIYAIVAALVVLVGVKRPYIGKRLLIMVPTLLVISVVSFTIIQLPPGDFLETKILQLQESGDESAMEELKSLREYFHLDKSMWSRYVRWMGIMWFIPERDEEGVLTWFSEKNEGLLQGNLGRSMEYNKPVNEIVGDRILLTFLISLFTILFTWTLALPIGIYSAVKQYSIPDYCFTFMAFIGMCVPSFLLALLVMYFSRELFGISVTGLFSAKYAAQPVWDWPKFVDLLKHIWLPVVVLGVGGTAGMVRIMRGNLLDELRKPYVTTARAKGVRPLKLLLKYPVRLALNPFVSGIGYIFPVLISGGAIVAMVMSLPTVGPMMLQALLSEDMYLAGSLLMVLSMLGILGTLVSDLLLLWLDPRIRFRAGTR